MAVTCLQKFIWPSADTGDRIYFPGDEIDDQDAAAFAKMSGYGAERGDQEPSRILPQRSPEDASTDLARAGGEVKETKAQRKARLEAEAAAAAAAAAGNGDQTPTQE